jgi:hypothetical protein
MSPEIPGSELGKQICSSFKNGGRSKDLINNATHYNTMREDIKMSNLGPGSYDLRDAWAPTSFQKYNKRPGKAVEKRYGYDSYEKPWLLSTTPPTAIVKTEVKNDHAMNKEELNLEMKRVLSLPRY